MPPKAHLLVVDDEANTAGFSVAGFSSGRTRATGAITAALTQITELRPHSVGRVMPGKDGLALWKRCVDRDHYAGSHDVWPGTH